MSSRGSRKKKDKTVRKTQRQDRSLTLGRIPRLFDVGQNAPPIMYQLVEVKNMDSVDDIEEWYCYYAASKMETAVSFVNLTIDDLNYQISHLKLHENEFKEVSSVLQKYFTKLKRTPREYNEIRLPISQYLIYDDNGNVTRHNHSFIVNKLSDANMKTHEFWRRNDFFLYILIRILNIVMGGLNDNEEGSRNMLQEVISSLRASDPSLDELLAELINSLMSQIQHRDIQPKRFATSFFKSEGVTASDAVSNWFRHAKQFYRHFIGVRNMCVDKTLPLIESSMKLNDSVKPELSTSNASGAEMVSVPSNFVEQCRKKLSNETASIDAAESERLSILAANKKLVEKSVHRGLLRKYYKNCNSIVGEKTHLLRLEEVKKLKEQRSYKIKLLQCRCDQLKQNISSIIRARAQACQPFLTQKAEEFAQKAVERKIEFERLQNERSEFLMKKAIFEASSEHQSQHDRMHWTEQIETIKQCIINRDNAQVNNLAVKQKILERAKTDETEAKNANRRSITVFCPFPPRLRPPFGKLDPTRETPVRAVPAVSQTLHALVNKSQRERLRRPVSMGGSTAAAEALKSEDKGSASVRKRLTSSPKKVVEKRQKFDDTDHKADISTGEIDALLEQSLEMPSRDTPKHLSIKQIHEIMRDTSRISLRYLTPHQIPLFMRSVLPVQPVRPIFFPQELESAVNFSKWMQSQGFDMENDPVDAPWRKWFQVLTMKHFLRYCTQESRRLLVIQAKKDLKSEVVFPEMICRQIQRNSNDANAAVAEAEKKKRLTQNLIKAKSQTATECFRLLKNLKEPLRSLHEAEEAGLANLKEKARLQNGHRVVTEHVDALAQWNNNLKTYKTACLTVKQKNEKLVTEMENLEQMSNRRDTLIKERRDVIKESIAQKRAEFDAKKKELAALREKNNNAEKKLIEKRQKIMDVNVEIESCSMKLHEVNTELAELKANAPDEITQELYKHYWKRLHCSLCNERQKDATFVKCYHLFCKDCVDKIVKSRDRRCPTCSIRVSAKDVVRVYL